MGGAGKVVVEVVDDDELLPLLNDAGRDLPLLGVDR